jgi:hypothetical protein
MKSGRVNRMSDPIKTTDFPLGALPPPDAKHQIGDPAPDAPTAIFNAEEVRILNTQAWNRAIDLCVSIVDQVAADYEHLGSSITGRQMRCVSLLLKPERKPE